jgi:hypothetical protein
VEVSDSHLAFGKRESDAPPSGVGVSGDVSREARLILTLVPGLSIYWWAHPISTLWAEILNEVAH